MTKTKLKHPFIAKRESVSLGVTLSIETMEYILNNFHPMNRKRNQGRQSALERDFRNGDYRSDVGHFIKFDIHGNLIDGQKRIHAALRCGTSLTINVHFGLPSDAMLYIDRGQPRTVAANYTLRKNVGKNRMPSAQEFSADRLNFSVASWCKHGLRWEVAGTPRDKQIWTERELMEFVAENESYLTFVLENATTVRPAVLGAMAIYAMKDSVKAMMFRNSVYGNGRGLVSGNPIHTLREYLKTQSIGGSYPIYDYNNTVRIINAFYFGHQLGLEQLNNERADWEF